MIANAAGVISAAAPNLARPGPDQHPGGGRETVDQPRRGGANTVEAGDQDPSPGQADPRAAPEQATRRRTSSGRYAVTTHCRSPLLRLQVRPDGRQCGVDHRNVQHHQHLGDQGQGRGWPKTYVAVRVRFRRGDCWCGDAPSMVRWVSGRVRWCSRCPPISVLEMALTPLPSPSAAARRAGEIAWGRTGPDRDAITRRVDSRSTAERNRPSRQAPSGSERCGCRWFHRREKTSRVRPLRTTSGSRPPGVQGARPRP